MKPTPSTAGPATPGALTRAQANERKQRPIQTNWTNFTTSAGARFTTCNYNAHRGWLDTKRHPDANGPDFTYAPGGRLSKRTWAGIGTSNHRIETAYSYGFNDAGSDHQHGDLISIAYSYTRKARRP